MQLQQPPITNNILDGWLERLTQQVDPVIKYNAFYPSANAVDHGVATASKSSIKDYVDAIGTSLKATLILKHNSSGNTTTYTLTTSETIPSNITLIIEDGAILDGAGTATINGSFEHGLSQCFGASITVVFGSGSIPCDYPEWWGIDGTADEVQINKAIVAATNILSVKLQNKTYTIAAAVVMGTADYMALIADGLAILTTSADINGVEVSERSTIRNVRATCSNGTPTKSGFLLTDGVHTSMFEKLAAIGFKYGFEMYSTTSEGIMGNTIQHFATTSIATADVYIHGSGDGWVNENLFIGGDLHLSATGHAGIWIYLSGCDQNKFYGVSMDGGNTVGFAIRDYGTNQFMGCRIETNGWGIYVHNTSTHWRRTTSIAQNLWYCKAPYVAVVTGSAHVNNEDRFIGGIKEGSNGSTTVDANSAADQKVLNIADTADIHVTDPIIIDSTGDREEWGIVDSIQAGVSITMQDNLLYTHTAVQADTVYTVGRKYGIQYRAADQLDFFTYGVLVFQIATTGNATLKGALTENTDPTP